MNRPCVVSLSLCTAWLHHAFSRRVSFGLLPFTPRRTSLLSLFCLILLVLTAIVPTASPTAAAASPTIYWGALVNGLAPSATNLSGPFATFEQRANKKMAIIQWGQPWKMNGSFQPFQTSYFENVRQHGAIPLLNWASWHLGSGATQPDFQLRDIYAGTYDAYLRQWAQDAKAWGKPFFLRFNHEMNGWWYPWGEGITSSGGIANGNSAGDYVKAWRHVHDIFTSVGATNVTWVWSPNMISSSSRYPTAASLYPGDSYVDWTGLSVYNKDPNVWMSFRQAIAGEGLSWMKNSYQTLLAVAPTKAIMLGEMGSLEAGDGGTKKAAWIKDALTTQVPTTYPQVKAIVWFNWAENASASFPIESSSAAQQAFAQAIAAPAYATNQYAALTTSPIPAPNGASSPSPGTPMTLSSIADTFITSANPSSTAGGTATELQSDADPKTATFFKFDLTPLAGKTLSSVKLRVKTTTVSYAGSSQSHSVNLVNDTSWKEAYMSYNNTVPVSSIVLGTLPASTVANTWYEISLSPSAIQGQAGSLLTMAVQTTGSDGLLLYSREATDKPQLVVTYQ